MLMRFLGRSACRTHEGAMCLQVGVAARAADTDNEGGELAQLMEALGEDERAAGGTKFGRDDKVIVMEGELKTLVGRVVEVKGDGFVRIMPILEGLDELDLPARHLQKYFQVLFCASLFFSQFTTSCTTACSLRRPAGQFQHLQSCMYH